MPKASPPQQGLGGGLHEMWPGGCDSDKLGIRKLFNFLIDNLLVLHEVRTLHPPECTDEEHTT